MKQKSKSNSRQNKTSIPLRYISVLYTNCYANMTSQFSNSPLPSRRQSRIDKAVADAVKKVTYIEAMAASENYETQSHNSKLENLVTLSKPNMLRRNSEESV